MPMDKIAFYGVGWQIHAENLATYLAGHELGDIEARWEELKPRPTRTWRPVSGSGTSRQLRGIHSGRDQVALAATTLTA